MLDQKKNLQEINRNQKIMNKIKKNYQITNNKGSSSLTIDNILSGKYISILYL